MIAAETEVLKLIARVSNFQVRLQVCIHVKGDIKVISCISNEFFFHIGDGVFHDCLVVFGCPKCMES